MKSFPSNHRRHASRHAYTTTLKVIIGGNTVSERIVNFYPRNAAKDPNIVLERARDQFEKVFVIGYNAAGSLDVRASLNFTVEEIVFAIEEFKHHLFVGSIETEVAP